MSEPELDSLSVSETDSDPKSAPNKSGSWSWIPLGAGTGFLWDRFGSSAVFFSIAETDSDPFRNRILHNLRVGT